MNFWKKDSTLKVGRNTTLIFYPEFEEEDFFRDIIVKAGKTFHLDKPTQVNGDIVVERGGSLVLDGAHLKIKGSILVQGVEEFELKILKFTVLILLWMYLRCAVRLIGAKVQCSDFCGFQSSHQEDR